MVGTNTGEDTNNNASPISHVSAPSLSLPKGGGAIRGMGEKFSVSPSVGTASFTIPIAASTGRSGFGPKLALTYDSGGGNGPFGFGWRLDVPAITRKTDKGLPRYRDELDVFILSGAEDLVPVSGAPPPPRTVNGTRYEILQFRPRIEGLFARIERWTSDTGDTHWRSITRDNVMTLYGIDDNSRIQDHAADAKHPNDPPRVFSYLISRTFDDKGNIAVYDYVAESTSDIHTWLAHEANRSDFDRGRQLLPQEHSLRQCRAVFPRWVRNRQGGAVASDRLALRARARLWESFFQCTAAGSGPTAGAAPGSVLQLSRGLRGSDLPTLQAHPHVPPFSRGA